eukprot:m.86856 g.86856  ORF g.86856 m.86856 type:complete len:313 (-) comp16375_c0_seq1:91-1029(-)
MHNQRQNMDVAQLVPNRVQSKDLSLREPPAPVVAVDAIAGDGDDVVSVVCSEQSGENDEIIVQDEDELKECKTYLRELLNREILAPDFLESVQRGGAGGVSEQSRQEVLVWIREFNSFFGFAAGTFAAAATLFDKILSVTRIKPEHGDIVGIGCLLIAAKQNEPRDVVPTNSQLCETCDHRFTEGEITRIEEIINKRLYHKFNGRVVISLDYLDEMVHYATLTGASTEVSTAEFEAVVTERMNSSTYHYELMSFRPSVLSLAVLDVEMQKDHLEATSHSRVVHELMEIMEIPQWDLENCKRCLSRYCEDDSS